MTTIHFLNVGEGDCTLIQHDSKRNTVIDICNGNSKNTENAEEQHNYKAVTNNTNGNYKQSEHLVNPITYFHNIGIKKIFRFICTHPDMDHLDGIEMLENEFRFNNFWDTKNNKESTVKDGGRYKKSDWDFYTKMRKSPDRRIYYHGSKLKYFAEDDNPLFPNGDGFYILAPTVEEVTEANNKQSDTYNDCSYILLLTANKRKILFGGDSEQAAWKRILSDNKLKNMITNIDVLIAPHHGRISGGDNDNQFLNVLNPKLTLLGIANSKYLNYKACKEISGLGIITNNQAGNIILDINDNAEIFLYFSNENFARDYCADKKLPAPTNKNRFGAWLIGKF